MSHRNVSMTPAGQLPRLARLALLAACVSATAATPAWSATDVPPQGALASAAAAPNMAAPKQNFLTDWQAAQARDPGWRVLQAAHDAGRTASDQASALWRPQLMLSAQAGWGAQQQRMDGAQFAAPGMPASSDVAFASQVRSGFARGWSLSAQQPLWSSDRSAMGHGLQLQADMGEAAWQHGRQQWMLGVVQAHLQVLMARQRMDSLNAELHAVHRSLEEAQGRFDAGKSPIAAVLDARARLDALMAQREAAQAAQAQANAAYTDLTGLPAAQAADLSSDATPAPALPHTGAAQGKANASDPHTAPDDWRHSVDAAQEAALQHPLLQQARLAVQQAQTELDQRGLTQGASLNLVARATDERIQGDGPGATQGQDARMVQTQRFVGLQWQMPIDVSGLRSAREREARARLDQAQAQLDQLTLQARQQARQAWLDERSALARVQAWQAAQASARQRLDATRTGVEVGDRTVQDLLRAQADAAATAFEGQQARQQAVMAQLQLAAACGALDEAALRRANAQLIVPSADHR